MNTLKKDLKEEAKIQRRRQNEEERKLRIFDAKTRLFGVSGSKRKSKIKLELLLPSSLPYSKSMSQ